MDSYRYIVSVDIGTTTIRACLYNDQCELITTASEEVNIIRMDPRTRQMPAGDVDVSSGELIVEMDPEGLYQQFVSVVSKIVTPLPPQANVSMGICCQRNSFVLWDKNTNQTISNFVVWSDTRARKSCAEWNKSWTVKLLHVLGGFLFTVSRRPRFKAAQVMKFLSALVSHRFLVTMDKTRGARQLLRNNQLGFGCIETYLVWKLSNSRVILTEPSSMSSTGMYDPFLADFNYTIMFLIGFPTTVLPPMANSASKKPMVTVPKSVFGRPIDVHCLLADQQAALYGVGGLNKGDMKISLGTGTFVDLNTGDSPHASMSGVYPLVGWCLDHKNIYVAEGNDHDTAVLLNWAKSIGLFEDVTTTSDIARNTVNPGVLFVPAFGGLQTPINDDSACCGFLGLRPHTTKEQMIRSILEAISFRVYQIWISMNEEMNFKTPPRIRICGGVANNDFVCQCISNLTGRPIERVVDGSMAASKGVAMMVGLMKEWWTEDDYESMIGVETIFEPITDERRTLLNTFNRWTKAVSRCSKFYE